MRAISPVVFVLAALAMLPDLARAADAEGCSDLKLFPRLDGCVITECSAKQHDSFDDGSGSTLDADTNSIVYSCPAANLPRMRSDFAVELRKAGFESISEDNADPSSPAIAARKGARFVQWSASTEEDAATYTLTTAVASGEKLKAEACVRPPIFTALRQCELVECNSRSEDSVAMRTAPNDQTALTGNVQTVALRCSSSGAAQILSAAETGLKASGFETLFSASKSSEPGIITARSGKRWVELANTSDGESTSFTMTIVASAEVLSPANPEPSPVEVAPPVAVASPPSDPPVAAPLASPQSEPQPPAPSPASKSAEPYQPVFIPPKPISEVPIEASDDLTSSIRGEVTINVLVDVDENGVVTNAVLAGHITRKVLKLESAALEAISHWRFEPARQDGRVVPAVKIPVQMHFRGRPWFF